MALSLLKFLHLNPFLILMNRLSKFLIFSLFLAFQLNQNIVAQSSLIDQINSEVTQNDIEFNIYFLASDEFLGRDTGTQELDIAARYIATWFQINGIKKSDGYDSYFQHVPLELFKGPDEITLEVSDTTYIKNRDLLLINDYRGVIDGPTIFLEYATEEELSENDVAGKIVIAKAGLPGQVTPQQLFGSTMNKSQWVEDAGAIGLIEIYNTPQLPWQFLVNFLSGDRMDLADLDGNEEENESGIPHLWINGSRENVVSHLSENSGSLSSISVTGPGNQPISSRNVIGVLEGTDPELKNEYILLGAHYDHVGVMAGHPEPITSEYIFNGARDNAVGTAGILAAAKFLAENPPKRSVIFAAWTAEERGLLGSRYFAENPMISLEQIVYNLNIDGAGYNDTTKVTVIGLGRTEADEDLKASAEAFGLTAIPDPVPEQNLFDRSDNVSFAAKGIPAPTYSMGLTAFDDEINYYYHQTTDEPQTLNFEYVTQYIRSFVLASLKVANAPEAPFWLPGDVYKPAGLELYGIE